MERLSFAENGLYSGLEASIHLARYAFARPLCQGKSVLDIACGEGYGSRLLADWGASKVVGVDVSVDSIDLARRMFGCPQVTFQAGSADALSDMFAPASFDLIVSLETIEHIADPEGLLRCFRHLLAPSGIIIVSCPNDWWYYPSDQENNPFHIRKYTHEQFRQLSEQVLGPAHAWFLGAPVAGFANVPVAGLAQASPSDSQGIMLGASALPGGLTLPAEANRAPTPENVSYFLGVWCEAADPPPPGGWQGAALLPASMDALVQGFFAQIAAQIETSRNELRTAQQSATPREDQSRDCTDSLRITRQMLEIERAKARSQSQQFSDQLRLEREAAAGFRRDAEQARYEREASDQKFRELETRTQLLELEAARYRRLRDLIPAQLRRRLVPSARRALNMVRRIVR